MKLKFLKDQALEESFHRIVAQERKVLHIVIMHVQEVARRKMYLAKGYGSLFTYLTSEMQYSNGAAQRRIEAARLMTAVPEVASKIESGGINLSQLNDIQRSVKSAESIHQVQITAEVKAEIIQLVQNQSVANTQRICAEVLDIPVIVQQTMKTQKDNSKRLQLTWSEQQYAKFERVRDLLAHKHFQTKRTQNIADVLETMFDELLSLLDPAEMKPNRKKSQDFGMPAKEGRSEKGFVDSASEISLKAQFDTSTAEVISETQPATSAAQMNFDMHFGTSVSEGNPKQTRKNPKAKIAATPAHDAFTHDMKSDISFVVESQNRWDPSRDISDEDLGPRTSVSEVKWRSLTPKRKKIILQRQQCCQYKVAASGMVCGSTFNLHVDHIHPKWAGGSNDAENLRVLCREHNLYRYRH